GENLTETQAELRSAGVSDAAPAHELGFLTPSAKPGSLGRLDHYEVLELIGRGGMGVVLKAFDEVLHRVVAVKVLAPQLATNATARKRFVREAQAGAAVCHDHVVTIHGVDEGKAVPYLVMQCVAGLSLQDKLDRDGPLSLQAILRIGMQTAEGLAAAHKQGLVHRDIKPANILLENGIERVKITDFGLARAVDDASITQSGVVAGTPQYMSPEQAQGETVDHRSDLFSLGSVLYAMCTGRPPFRATGTMAVLKRVCEETPRPIREINPDIPEWLCAIIAKANAKKPADRFQSAKEVAGLLSQHLAHWQQPSGAALPLYEPSSEPRPTLLSASTVATPSDQPFNKKHALRAVLLATWAFICLPILLISTFSVLGVTWSGLLAFSLPALLVVLLAGWRGNRRWAVIQAIVILAVRCVLVDYNTPAWWKQLWGSIGRPDQTSSDATVMLNWEDPDLVVVLVGPSQTYVSGVENAVAMGVKPGEYTIRA